MKAAVYNQTGKETGNIDLPESVFGLPWNADLVHQVVVSMQANARTPVAHTKDRREVRGGGRKPWKQKGTGSARHGSRRSPLWRGGGITFGPRNEKDYSKKINKKMRSKALRTVLSQKLRDGELLMLENLVFPEAKTKQAHTLLTSLSSIPMLKELSSKKRNAALFALSEKDTEIERSFRNLANVDVAEVRNLNPVSLLSHKYVIVVDPQKAVSFWAPQEAAKPTKKKITK
jgi:large subunit ribosomal protein L4